VDSPGVGVLAADGSAAVMEIGSPVADVTGSAAVEVGVPCDGDTIGPEVLRWIGSWVPEVGHVGISRSGAPMPPGRVRQLVGAGDTTAGVACDGAAASDCPAVVG